MSTHADKTQENRSRSVADGVIQKQSGGESTFVVTDNRPVAVAQRKLQEMVNNSLRATQLKTFQGLREAVESNERAKGAMRIQSQTETRSRLAGGRPVLQRVKLKTKGVDGLPLETDNTIALMEYVREAVDRRDKSGLDAFVAELRAFDADRVPWAEAFIARRESHRLALELTNVNQVQEADIMAGRLNLPPMGTGPAIPQIIHRFWTGGPMSDTAVKILIDSIKKTQGREWQHCLWYSSRIEEKIAGKLGVEKIKRRDGQREALQAMGYRVEPIENQTVIETQDLETGADLASSTVLTGGGYDDVKYFSDLARLLYLQEHGGHHMDIDVGLGDMDLDAPYHHNDPTGNVPLLGSLARDPETSPEIVTDLAKIDEFHARPRSGATTPEAFRETAGKLAERAGLGAGMFNALIASQAGTPNLAAAIDKLVAGVGKKELLTGMGANRQLLGVDEYHGFDEQANLSVPPYLLRLEHLTAESSM